MWLILSCTISRHRLVFVCCAAAVCGRPGCAAAGRVAAERLRSRFWDLALYRNQHLRDHRVEVLQPHNCEHGQRSETVTIKSKAWIGRASKSESTLLIWTEVPHYNAWGLFFVCFFRHWIWRLHRCSLSPAGHSDGQSSGLERSLLPAEPAQPHEPGRHRLCLCCGHLLPGWWKNLLCQVWRGKTLAMRSKKPLV